MDDEILTLPEAAAFIKLGQRTLREWVADGLVPATRTGTKGGKFLFLKSDLIASVRNRQQNHVAGALDGHEGRKEPQWQSSSEGIPGTVISLRQTESELERRLGQRTKSRLRSSTTR